jgi:hypothetical protein
MIQSFRRFLEIRKVQILKDICNDINSLSSLSSLSSSSSSLNINISELPMFIAYITSLLNPNHIMIPGSDVDSNSIRYNITKKEDVFIIFDSIKKTLDKFSKNQ